MSLEELLEEVDDADEEGGACGAESDEGGSSREAEESLPSTILSSGCSEESEEGGSSRDAKETPTSTSLSTVTTSDDDDDYANDEAKTENSAGGAERDKAHASALTGSPEAVRRELDELKEEFGQGSSVVVSSPSTSPLSTTPPSFPTHTQAEVERAVDAVQFFEKLGSASPLTPAADTTPTSLSSTCGKQGAGGESEEAGLETDPMWGPEDEQERDAARTLLDLSAARPPLPLPNSAAAASSGEASLDWGEWREWSEREGAESDLEVAQGSRPGEEEDSTLRGPYHANLGLEPFDYQLYPPIIPPPATFPPSSFVPPPAPLRPLPQHNNHSYAVGTAERRRHRVQGLIRPRRLTFPAHPAALAQHPTPLPTQGEDKENEPPKGEDCDESDGSGDAGCLRPPNDKLPRLT